MIFCLIPKSEKNTIDKIKVVVKAMETTKVKREREKTRNFQTYGMPGLAKGT
jgi:hypothetical protein